MAAAAVGVLCQWTTAACADPKNRIVFFDTFDTHTLSNTDMYELWHVNSGGYDSPLRVEYDPAGHVSVGCDGISSRVSILSCTMPRLPPDADTYRIQIHFLESIYPGAGHVFFGYGLLGKDYIGVGTDLDGHIVDMASGAGGRRTEFHYYKSASFYTKYARHCDFSPFTIRKISVEIDRSGVHHITWTFDTGAPYERKFDYSDTPALARMIQMPTKLQLRGAFSANQQNYEGRINTDTWSVEAIFQEVGPPPSKPKPIRRHKK